jgi:site-specific DNA recombinase
LKLCRRKKRNKKQACRYQDVTIKALNQILRSRDAFLEQLQKNIAKAVVITDTLSPDGIQARLEELQVELLKKVDGGSDYKAITDEILRLQEMKSKSKLDNHRRDETMNRIKELQDFITGQNTDIREFDESLVWKLIKSITVYADKFTVEFKSCVSVDIAE